MKIRNTKTGEVKELGVKKVSEEEPKKSKIEQSEDRIKERGTIQDSVKKVSEGKGKMEKFGGALEVVAAPFNAFESALANPAIAIQKGTMNPIELTRQAILGASLQRQGQYGDVMKNAGFNPLLADTTGLVLSAAPIKVYGEIAKTFSTISKMSDKGLAKAGTKILDAITEAKTAAGTKVSQEYAKGADSVAVDGMKFINAIAELPAPIIKKAELVFGDLSQYAQSMTVGKLREFKRLVGKLKPNSFGQAEHGIQETLDVKDTNRAYSNLKGLMQDTLSNKAVSGLEKKAVEHLMNLDTTYSEIIDASRYIRKTMVDATLNKATKVGSLAKKVVEEGDTSARTAFNTIKKASSKANYLINQSVDELHSYNRWQAGKGIIRHGFNAAVFGGMAGAIGGKILNKAAGRSES